MILHTPVLLHEVCSFLNPESKLIVDCTLGHGGHTMALLSLAKYARLVGFDVDQLMLKKAEFRIQNSELEILNRIEFVHGNYADIQNVL